MTKVVYPAREGRLFKTDANLVAVRCPECHILYAIPESLDRAAQKWTGSQGWNVSCPLGHTWHYTGPNIEQKLEQERERSARLAAERDQAEASARAYKGVATKAKKRAAAALCPCCNRSFVQLRRHLETKHPDYDPDGVNAA